MLETGLVVSGVVFVLVHAAHLDLSALLDPSYRISLFLNTNGVGFIAAATAVALLGHVNAQRWRARCFLGALFIACAFVVLATKSRTASMAFLSGSAIHVWLQVKRTPRLAVLLAAVAAVASLLLLVGPASGRIDQYITRLYMLDDDHRSLQSGTYRYEAWSYVINELWLERPLLGVGPGRHGAMVEAAIGVTSAHNGILANLAEVGALGVVPLILVLAMAFAKGRAGSKRHLPLLVAGLVESGAEVMMFSMGNTGSLLFLLAVAAMSTGEPRVRHGPPILKSLVCS